MNAGNAGTRGPGSKLGLALGSIVVAVALCVGLELALRALGVGAPGARGASRLPYQRLVQPVLRAGQQADGTEVLVPADPRLPYQRLRRAKPDDGLRVIVFGGSATAGLGYSPNVTFARYLERLLRDARPDRTVEVLNLGITALSSNQVLELVREVSLRYEPDALVVYSGNNEFLELHAEKYVLAHAGFAAHVQETLRDTNLVRAVTGASRRRAVTSDELRAGESSMRLTQSEIIEDIALSPGEVEGVVERYGENLRAIAEVARASGTPLVLMTVASNWEWRGKQDLPDGWKARAYEELSGEPGSTPVDDAALLALLDARLAGVGEDSERHELLFRRATLLAELERFDEARRDYREAMNVDPHLRRALDAMNERTLALTEEPGTLALLDTVAFLERRATHGIVGFEHFYDYVHFTPEGAVLVASAVHRALGELLGAPVDDALVDATVERELQGLRELERDPLDARRWLGVGDAPRAEDRDLWKYERLLSDLDRALDEDPSDAVRRVWRGNARSFRLDGADGALADWRRALETLDSDEVRANVERLERERDVTR